MITIITAIYKSDKYLGRYAERLVSFADYLEKKGRKFEVIIVPQMPSVKEKEILTSLSQHSWLKVIEGPRPSLYGAWNIGIRASCGNIIGFWNVDDVRLPEAVIDAEDRAAEGAQLVYFPFDIKWYLNFFSLSFLVKKKHIDCLNLDRKEFQRSMPFASFWMATRELFRQVGPFDEQFRIAADMDWTIRAAKNSDRFRLSDRLAGNFRVDGHGLSAGRRNERRVAESNIIYLRHHIYHKLEPVREEMMAKFSIEKAMFYGEWKDYSEVNTLFQDL